MAEPSVPLLPGDGGHDPQAMTEDESAPGWDAVDAALAHVYRGVEAAFHLTTDLSQRIISGGTEALDLVSAVVAVRAG